MDDEIEKGAVVRDERGTLYIALGRFYREEDGTREAWFGIGFNGKSIRCQYPTFVAKNVNAFINAQ